MGGVREFAERSETGDVLLRDSEEEENQVMLARVPVSRQGQESQIILYGDAVFMGGLALMILTLPISEALKNIGYFIALGGWVLKRTAGCGFRITFTPIGIFFSLYLLTSLVSAAFAFDRWEGFRGVWDVFRSLSIFLMMVNDVNTTPKVRCFVWLFIGSTGMGVVWGLLDYFSGSAVRVQIKSLGNPVHVATYLVIMLALLISLLFLMDWPIWAKMAVGLIAGATHLALFLTYSRGGWVAYLTCLLFLSISLKRWEPILVIALLTMAILVGLNTSGRLWTQHFEMLAHLSQDESVIERVKMWRGSVLSFKDRPLLGVGPRNFKNLDSEKYGFERRGGGRWTDAHSLFFTVMAERGLLGLLSLVALFICYAYEGIKRWPTEDALSRALWHAAMGSFIAIVVNGMMNTTFHSEVAMAFASLTALMLAFGEAEKPSERGLV